MRDFVAVLVVVISLSGCSEPRLEETGAAEKGSASVNMIDENEPPSAVAEWSLSSSPSVVIAAAEGELGSVPVLSGQITDVALLSNGNIAAVDFADAAIRMFDSSGRYLRDVGRRGQGPGEFQSPHTISECESGRLYALDLVTSVMKVFSIEGDFIRERRLVGPEPDRPPYSWACGGGKIVSVGWGAFDPRQEGPLRVEVPIAISRAMDGHQGETLQVGGPELYLTGRGGGPRPLGVQLGIAVGSDQVYYSDKRLFEITAVGFDGDPQWEVRGNSELRPAEPDLFLESLGRDTLSAEDRTAFDARWDAHEFPVHLPATRGLQIDGLGNVWSEGFPSPKDKEVIWRIFSRSGEWLATLAISTEYEVLDIGVGRIAVVTYDGFDLPTILVFPVEGMERN